jgi:hypothetical protein
VRHTPLLNANFYAFLHWIDKDLAAKTQAGGCRRCDSTLHKNRFPRKPRAAAVDVVDPFRLSLSCSKCNKRHTPPSVRWLDRKVYLAAIVVLASALRAGLTDQRAARLRVHQCSQAHNRAMANLVAARLWRECILEDCARPVDAADHGRGSAGQFIGAVWRP